MERRVCTLETGRKLFLLCWITYMISSLGRYNYMSVMAELITTEGFSKSGAGLIGTALFMVYGACQIVTGVVGDKVSPKRMVTFGLVGSGTVNIVMGCASTQPIMLTLWIINGIFQACMWSPVARLFAEMLPPPDRMRSCSNAAATLPTSTILIYLFSAFSIRFFNWRYAFWVPGILMLVTAVIWLHNMTLIENDTKQHGMVEHVPVVSKTQGNLWQIIISSGTVFIAIAALSHGLLKDGIQSWMPTFLTESFHMTTYASAVITLVLPICNICGVIFTRWLVSKWIHNELRAASKFFMIALSSLILLILLGIQSGPLSLIALTLASTTMIGANILLINVIPMHFGVLGRASTMTGILNCCAYAGSAISSFGIGAVVEYAGWNAAIWFWLTFAILAALAAWFTSRRWGEYIKQLSSK